MLKLKYSRAVKGLASTKEAFEALTDSLSPALVEDWSKAEKKAMKLRGDHLRIYDVRITKGTSHHHVHKFQVKLTSPASAPTMAEVKLRLTDKQSGTALVEGSVAWLSSGIAIEAAQYVFNLIRQILWLTLYCG